MQKETIRKNVLALLMMIMLSLTIGKPILAADNGSNTIATAIPIKIGSTINGSFPNEETIHYYQFTIPASGEVTAKGGFDASINYLEYCIYDEFGSRLSSDRGYNNSISNSYHLTKGTYYFSVATINSYGYSGAYRFNLQLEDAHESFPESYGGSDNSKFEANIVSLNKSYSGHIGVADEEDWYKFTISASGQYEFAFLTSSSKYVYIYNEANQELAPNRNQYYIGTWELTAGTYYLKVSDYNGPYSFQLSAHTHNWENYSVTQATLNKNGSIDQTCSCGATNTITIYAPSSVQLTQQSFNFTGKSQKPRVVVTDRKGKTIDSSSYIVTYDSDNISVGKHNVIITFKGNYSGSVTKSYNIAAKATSISKLKAAKKGFTVKIKKLSDKAATGYQIQYATNKNFKNAKAKKTSTTSLTVTKLKGKKTYYVRVRSYKLADGKTYYSAWSAAKKVKTKK